MSYQQFDIGKIERIVKQENKDLSKKYFIIQKDKAPQSNRKQGQVFYQNGKLWTMSGGIQIQKVSSNQFNCKKCNKWCHRKMDLKYLRAQGICQDCFLKIQTQMRVDGTWDDYISKIQLQQAIGTLKDRKQQLQITRQQTLQGQLTFCGNSYGDVQKWELPKQRIIASIDQKLNAVNQLIHKFQIQYDKLKQKVIPISEIKN